MRKITFSKETYQQIEKLASRGVRRLQICDRLGISLYKLKSDKEAQRRYRAGRAALSEIAEQNYAFLHNLISAKIAQVLARDPNLAYTQECFTPEQYRFIIADAARHDKNKKDLRDYHLKKDIEERRAKLEERRVNLEEARLELERQRIEALKPAELPALSCRPMTAEEEWDYMADSNKEGLNFEDWKRETHPDE